MKDRELMSSQRFLVTGALGCIGAWAVKRLVDEQIPVWTYDLGSSTHRLRLIMDDTAFSKVTLLSGDITDLKAFERAVADNGITHIIHLAALQVPFVRADPVAGAQVNVVGTAVVLEAVKRHKDHVQGLAYASSIAVYGPGGGPAPTLYGVYKQANEGMARIYAQDHGINSIGLRPHTVYGPGRDQGMTSSPTKAMLAAAAGRKFQINYGGVHVYHYADDIAAVFIQAARAGCQGAQVYNVGGIVATMDEVVNAINAAAPEMAGQITFAPTELPVHSHYDGQPLEAAIGPIHWTPLNDGVRKAIAHFRTAATSGRIDVDKALA